jgi:glycosyltransferase involved in cell wall biosynthesis
MDIEPLVSIVIDNYNYDLFLAQAIDGALGQTYSNIEVVVVDDGSTDNSCDVIAWYGDRIVSVLKTNGGQASALNAGFAASKGEVICLLDAYDLFLPEKVSEVVELFLSQVDVDWVFTESVPVQLNFPGYVN